jgi:hypothetical protein
MTYQISEDMMYDIAGDLNDQGDTPATWAVLANQYGIPADSLRRAYERKSREIYRIP